MMTINLFHKSSEYFNSRFLCLKKRTVVFFIKIECKVNFVEKILPHSIVPISITVEQKF